MKDRGQAQRSQRGGRHPRGLVVLGVTAVLLLGLAVSPSGAAELDEAFLRIEINASDGDAGLHGKFDGEPSRSMMIRNPKGSLLSLTVVAGALRKQGLTENFFESAEPTCAEQPLAAFLARFPQGTYSFQGKTIEGEDLEGEADLSHALPAAPDISGFDGSLIPAGDPVVVAWAPGSDLGACDDPALVANGTIPDPAGVPVDSWEVTVEPDVEDDLLEALGLPRSVFTVQLLPGQLGVTVSPEYVQPYVAAGITTFKFEVGAKAGENQTFSEGGFEIVP